MPLTGGGPREVMVQQSRAPTKVNYTLPGGSQALNPLRVMLGRPAELQIQHEKRPRLAHFFKRYKTLD